ncbi:MAG: STAS domain-containing protein [Micromonosporaceae bacterium]
MSEPHALRITIDNSPDEVMVVPIGDIDLATAESLATQAIGQLRSSVTFTIDMHAVSFCDSAGINVLVRLRNECERERSSFQIINAPEHLRVLLEITGLLEFLNVRTSGVDQ